MILTSRKNQGKNNRVWAGENGSERKSNAKSDSTKVGKQGKYGACVVACVTTS